MSKKLSLSKLRKRKAQFLQLRTLQHLAQLINIEPYKLQLLAMQPKYRVFSIPKKSGKLRWIEDPLEPLKTIQKDVNKYLQAVFYFIKSEAAFGFISTCKNDPDPRNILTNAQKHLGCNFLINMDLEDFFHTISITTIENIFRGEPFNFDYELANLLSSLSCHQNRLPMGASTSPVLSNLVAHKMDLELLTYSNWSGITYTRFADDMSFSSRLPIPESTLDDIRKIIESHSFELNANKLKKYAEEQTKIITGLWLKEKIALPSDFFPKLIIEIERLDKSFDLVSQYRRKPNEWIKLHQQKVRGVLAFAGMILGEDDQQYSNAETLYERAITPRICEDSGSFSWFDFPYL